MEKMDRAWHTASFESNNGQLSRLLADIVMEVSDRVDSVEPSQASPQRRYWTGHPRLSPSSNLSEVRLMFSVAMEFMICAAMKMQMYSFNAELRNKLKGGAIGNTLNGALCPVDVVMGAEV